MAESVKMDVNKYFARIGLPQAPSMPLTLSTVHKIQRRVLHSLCFENLDVRASIPIPHSLEAAYVKIVERKRGGFCYEMNCLLQWALKAIGFDAELYFGNGYSEDNTTIKLPEPMPSTYVSDGYIRGTPGWNWQTHVVIVVRLDPKDCDDSEFLEVKGGKPSLEKDGLCSFFVDVGYGEPPQAALWMKHGLEQTVSKTGDRFILEFEGGQWYQARWNGTKWVRRVKWSTQVRTYAEIDHGLTFVQTEFVWFHYKTIVVLLSDKVKMTLSNMELIQTILPTGAPIKIPIETRERYFEILKNIFGMELDEKHKTALNLSA